MSVLVVVFLLQLFLFALNSVSAQTINELLWTLYNRSPLSAHGRQYAEAARLKREAVRLKREMAAVSAQDEFARWAKLRRQHDKAVAEHDKASGAFQASRKTFDTYASTGKFIATAALRYLPQYYYSKTPVFWLPRGWVPYFGEWLLSFPRAPLGGVSVQVWGLACAAVLKMLGEVVVALYALLGRGQSLSEQEGSAKMAHGVAGTAPEKKEL